ncbi:MULTISPECIES: hypothetical protein [unclassified Oleiphilus]|jgi:hypothetical protein|uniref:hypothetical protein n=2 Tax=Oleiphilus TaxID=141450 RepID=UPI0007C2E75C|nr:MULTISPECIES: hypothetical protein [unclassified Oleiphilus]KZY40725.1 hypothetical protein A3732_03405 [Oleiphilus sp. HI0050]KZY76150.1 hypothetical protein A3741_11160 [Oleiphilus sp. HI0069]KZY76630.1 hypothetical protein A3740_12275 [Oleiphilus sp. HI0068]KZZ36547.1 hypothetical protein A3757_13600 [Oleiphilus sp. HI0117]KZZ36621.1 hypothetical protein A3756_12650 [Oleiphilus sp. HI0086]
MLSSGNALASVEGELGFQARTFVEEGLADQSQFQSSLSGQIEFDTSLGQGDFVAKVFGRYDFEDDERTHFDLREALWTYYGDSWELQAGVGKVFWGVTESMHLVDIVNQSDSVENPDGEDKLGQAMLKFSLERDWGTIDLFWLPYFRERTFVGEDGRLSASPLPVSNDEASYASGAQEWHSDFAVRYSHYVGELEFALSHFSGTSREASFRPNATFSELVPHYHLIDQTGIELQYIYDSWLLKFEGITNSGFGDALGRKGRYSAAVFGFEYTQVGIFESSADLGWVLEYMFDDRKEHATHAFERDIFAGWRYAFNDEDSSEILTGVIFDPRTEELMFSFEANKRLASDLKLNIEARVFHGAESDDQLKTYGLRDEDYLELELVKYF